MIKNNLNVKNKKRKEHKYPISAYMYSLINDQICNLYVTNSINPDQ